MAVVQFPVQCQEDLVFMNTTSAEGKSEDWKHQRTVIHQWGDYLRLRPFRFCIELLRKPVPPAFVCSRDLREVIVGHRRVELHDELFP